MNRNGKRIALSLVAIVLGAGFLLKVIPPETVIGDNDHHSASIDGLLITNPITVNDPVTESVFPLVASPALATLPGNKGSSPLWIPGETETTESLSYPPQAQNGKPPSVAGHGAGPKQGVGNDEKSGSAGGPGVDQPNGAGSLPGPLLHDPKTPNLSDGNPPSGGGSNPGQPKPGPGEDGPPPSDHSSPPPTNPGNDSPKGPLDDDGRESFPPSIPDDFPSDTKDFPSDPGTPTFPPTNGSDSPDTPTHSVPDQGTSLALTLAGLLALSTVHRFTRRQ
jgi:hypothetical protein